MKKDGNSKNGYHKVKCQVPETEELERTEKRNRKRTQREREKGKITNYSEANEKKRMRHLHFHILMHIIHYTTVSAGPLI